MEDTQIRNKPKVYTQLEAKCKEIGFTMPSDVYIGALLKTLVASKPGGRFLELGTGIGLSLSWMVEGMDSNSKLVTIDNDPRLIQIVRTYFSKDQGVEILLADGSEWIKNYSGPKFDLIFADAWPGKYSDLDQTLAMLKVGGFYVIDDMTAQANWPEGHQENVNQLINDLDDLKNFHLTKLNWSTGVVLATKISERD